MSTMSYRPRKLAKAGWLRFKRLVEGPRRPVIDAWVDFLLTQATPADWKMLTSPYDDSLPLPEGAAAALQADNPRLQALRQAYAGLSLPVTQAIKPWQWSQDNLQKKLDLRYFRGDSPYVWHYGEWPRAMRLKFFIYAQYMLARDKPGLLAKLGEDGLFGCWSYDYAGYGRFSRDLLDSVNELLFLDRQLGILGKTGLRVLDIGAGYGRLAHRMLQAIPGVADYCCVDAIPESTFLCEYYLGFRGLKPPARVVPLPELEQALRPDSFDLALNIHSFAECTYDAVAWWAEQLKRLQIPNLLIIPNHPTDLYTTENDGSNRDFRPLIEAAGYELVACEPTLNDPVVQQLVYVADHFFLFRRRS